MPQERKGAAVVTGGGSGIGRAISMRMIRDGYPVIIADVNEKATADTISLAREDECTGSAEAAPVDVSDELQVAELMQYAVRQHGELACVVNNAGVGGAFGPVDEIEVADWDYTFAVLARGVFLGTKHATKAMRRAGHGSIVNVASVAAFTGGFGPQAYSSAKAAVVNFTRACSLELAKARIRINAVCPGVISTPMAHGGNPESLGDKLSAAQPWPDVGQPEDVAASVSFLAGPESLFITGQYLTVDGGLSAAGAGEAFLQNMNIDPGLRGLVGVSKGTTGVPSEVHRKVQSS